MSAPHRQGGREGLDEGAITTPGASIGERIAPSDVHEVLGRHLLHDSYPMVFDPVRSHGAYIVEPATARSISTSIRSSPPRRSGSTPPASPTTTAFLRELAVVAANKPANSDIHTTYLAEFVETFWRVLGDPALPHLFFIEGGAAAVDNAVKVAFDWKSRRNEGGRPLARSSARRVMHLRHAFHGRGGYTLSLTNTDPVKVDRFPKFDWPRIPSPAIRFPLSEHLAEVEEEPRRRHWRPRRCGFAAHPHDIACFIAEPIQAEGGDRHLRRRVPPRHAGAVSRARGALRPRRGADRRRRHRDTLVLPAARPRARRRRIREEGAAGRCDGRAQGRRRAGERLPGAEPDQLHLGRQPDRHGPLHAASRDHRVAPGRSTTRAATAPISCSDCCSSRTATPASSRTPADAGCWRPSTCRPVSVRDEVLTSLRTDEHVLALACGDVSLRFRPSLAVSAEEVDLACEALDRVLQKRGA